MRCAFFGRVIGVVVLMMTTAACTGQEVDGLTPEEAFEDPQVVLLVKAAGRGDVKEIERLVNAGTDVNVSGKKGLTPLLWGMYHLQKGVMRKLLELGADPNHQTDYGRSAIWLAAGHEDSELLEILLRAGGDPNAIAHGRDSLTVAVLHRDLENVTLLVRYGADVNQVAKLPLEGVPAPTAAITACRVGQWDIVVFLLEHGYTYELQYLARCVGVRPPSKNREFEEGRNKVKKMLEERGVSFSDLSRER